MLEVPLRGSAIWEADSFIFSPGRSYLVEAASGKGKTSLLSVIYGLRKDYRGSLYIDDKNALGLKLREWSKLRKHKVSYIFQGLELFDDLTALENILLKNKITGYKSSGQIMEMAERLDIAASLSKKCSILSFGQKQRVAIIRALCQPFEYLLADECFSHIDKKNSFDAMKLIRE